MADDTVIRESDLIEPDGSIEKLIKELEDLTRSYGNVMSVIKKSARDIASSLKAASGATARGRAQIDEATAAANRLTAAQKELAFSASDTGKEVARLKAQTRENNKATVEQMRAARELATSYRALKRELNDSVTAWKSMDNATRQGTKGQVALNNIISLKQQLSVLDKELKSYTVTLTENQKAQARLDFLRTAEGKDLLAIRREITEVTRAEREAAHAGEELAKAKVKLTNADSSYARELYNTNVALRERTHRMQLEEQIANSAEGSYNRLAAQYELNKIKLQGMSRATETQKRAAMNLEEQTRQLYNRMKLMQESMGNHRLSLGEYNKVWNGLGYSVSQVIRELPSAAISLNTFFIAISNNIPIVVDELKRLKVQNETLRAEGRPTQSAIKTIISALLSWQTALILVLTALSMHGEAIIKWLGKVMDGTLGVLTLKEALENISAEVEKGTAQYGEQRATLELLSIKWKELGDNLQKKKQFIKDNTDEFKKLDVNIKSVTGAEDLLVKNTDTFLKAMALRAKITAASSLAAKEYEKALAKQIDLENKQSPLSKEELEEREYWKVRRGQTGNKTIDDLARARRAKMTDEQLIAEDKEYDNAMRRLARQRYAKGAGVIDYLRTGLFALMGAGNDTNNWTELLGKSVMAGISAIETDMHEFEDAGEVYIELIEKFQKQLNEIGIEEYHKDSKGRRQKDLSPTLIKEVAKVYKKYRESETNLIYEEFIREEFEIQDNLADELDSLNVLKNKFSGYLTNTAGTYKDLTDDQKELVEDTVLLIDETIKNLTERAQQKLKVLNINKRLNDLALELETFDLNVSNDRVISVKSQPTEDARKLMLNELRKTELQKVDAEEALAYATDGEGNAAIQIAQKYARMRVEVNAKYDAILYNQEAQAIEGRLALVQKGSEEELHLLLKQNEIARDLALTENAAKPAAERKNPNDIKAGYNQNALQIAGNFYLTGLEQTQALQKAQFDIIRHSTEQVTAFQLKQERDMWNAKISLAKIGALTWSKPQIEAAEATVAGINNQLKKVTNFTGFMKQVGDKGLEGGILASMGFDDDYINALGNVVNKTIEYLQEITAAEVELAEVAVQTAEKRVNAAQSAYEAELEARANGYANNVASTKAELALEKQKQKEKEQLLAEAQRKQEAINTVMQVSSLITATANLWSSLSGIPFVGYALAIAAIAGMWASFAAAKIKAQQVAGHSDEYGEGGLEFLEGGSHASGHDIDLHTTNSRGNNMRAEGGEALAVINKKQTKHYRKALPDIIDSLNKGTFEDKYLSAFNAANDINFVMRHNDTNIDLSTIEKDVSDIKNQNKSKYYVLSNGYTVIQKGNVKRIIKN